MYSGGGDSGKTVLCIVCGAELFQSVAEKTEGLDVLASPAGPYARSQRRGGLCSNVECVGQGLFLNAFSAYFCKHKCLQDLRKGSRLKEDNQAI